MTDKDLKKLSRAELLEMLIAESKEVKALKDQVEQLQLQLNDKSIAISNAGSIAEASLQLNDVFKAADAAAQQYLENIRQAEGLCKKKKEDTEKKAAEIIEYAKGRAAVIEAEAKGKADSYWALVSERLEHFYNEHRGLKELLQVYDKRSKE